MRLRKYTATVTRIQEHTQTVELVIDMDAVPGDEALRQIIAAHCRSDGWEPGETTHRQSFTSAPVGMYSEIMDDLQGVADACRADEPTNPV